jgi:hypothetical protein
VEQDVGVRRYQWISLRTVYRPLSGSTTRKTLATLRADVVVVDTRFDVQGYSALARSCGECGCV